jgi:hypothetical protein
MGEADVLDRRSLKHLRSPRLYCIQPVVYLYGISSCSIRATQSIQCILFYCATTFSSRSVIRYIRMFDTLVDAKQIKSVRANKGAVRGVAIKLDDPL